jgi:hypothetical protein
MATQKQIAYTILTGFGITLFVIGMMWIAIADSVAPVKHIPVKCYDRWQNEIKDLTCLQDDKNYIPILFPYPLFLTISGLCFIILGAKALINETDKINFQNRKYY